MSFSELGEGWTPAVMNTDNEEQFIEDGQKELLTSHRNFTLQFYWIGGVGEVERAGGANYLRQYIPELGTPESWVALDPMCEGP